MKPMNLQTKKPRLSPQAAKVAGASFVALVAVGAIVLVAHQATPAAKVAPIVKPAVNTDPAPAPMPVKKGSAAKGKTANASASAVVKPEIVTITGCLEQKGDEFRLKDTGGSDAPKSRSWKTLGITKHASTVTLVDTGNRMKLGKHVGERVSVTGGLVDKELQPKSLKTLTASCD